MLLFCYPQKEVNLALSADFPTPVYVAEIMSHVAEAMSHDEVLSTCTWTNHMVLKGTRLKDAGRKQQETGIKQATLKAK